MCGPAGQAGHVGGGGRARDPAAKIIMLSAMGDEELMKSAKDIGIRVFLQKPFKSDEMMKAIAQVMGASGA